MKERRLEEWLARLRKECKSCQINMEVICVNLSQKERRKSSEPMEKVLTCDLSVRTIGAKVFQNQGHTRGRHAFSKDISALIYLFICT